MHPVSICANAVALALVVAACSDEIERSLKRGGRGSG